MSYSASTIPDSTSELLLVKEPDATLAPVDAKIKFKMALSKALGLIAPERSELMPIVSGAPAHLIQSIFNEAFQLLSPKQIQLLVEETDSSRMFLWHSELQKEGYSVVNSEEFDHSTADEYLQSIPSGDWILQVHSSRRPLLTFESKGKRPVSTANIPLVLLQTFDAYNIVMSVAVNLGDEWQGRLIVCNPSINGARPNLEAIRQFARTAARSIHAAHLCLRACRETAAEERSRLARELHDGPIQSLLGVELRLESLKRNLTPLPHMQKDVSEVQEILRREATELRKMVNDSRRRALRPERLLEYLSDQLERFQRDTGVITRFFADLHNEPMPPLVCHEIARMTEEGITNVRKHSKASTFTVRVGSVEDNWLLVMVDDGIGFEFQGTWPLEKLASAGLGPRVIRERALSLGGNLIIESTPTGARIEISIPKASKVSNPSRTTTLTKTRQDESYSHTAS
jgi:signal transduction histidine kinase